MKVCTYKGLALVVMLRDEHCPPHVHVDGGRWSARFRFSFWHNGVALWDVIPVARRPSVAVLEGLRQALKQPAHLRLARSIWWRKLQTVCLVNQRWDWQADEVTEAIRWGAETYRITAAGYDICQNTTQLQLFNAPHGVEIEL